MVYALVDGTAVIELEHLQAAASVWRYCEDSARIVFTSEDDTGTTTERLLLAAIKQEPGMMRPSSQMKWPV